MMIDVRRLLPVLVLVAACSFAPGNIQSRQSTDLEKRGIKRIAVVPPVAALEEIKRNAPYTGAVSDERKPSEREAPLTVARLLYSSMAPLPHWQIVSESEVREVAQKVTSGTELARILKIGELVYADAVLTSRVIRFRERVGDQWGAKSPASVAFVVDLLDVKRGDVVWSARFDETQKSLTENILALGDISQRGVKWLTAEELAADGARKVVNQLHQALYRTRS
ncbi:MAG TPA: hypothetical protein VFU31_12395 [Candidatus Binatia bacterium]|nr:hypothetical protein [Candidatus Binatia bacterium]